MTRIIQYPAKQEPPFQPQGGDVVTSDKWAPGIADVFHRKTSMQSLWTRTPAFIEMMPVDWQVLPEIPRARKRTAEYLSVVLVPSGEAAAAETLTIDKWNPETTEVMRRKSVPGMLVTRAPLIMEAFPTDWLTQFDAQILHRRPQLRDYPSTIDTKVLTLAESPHMDALSRTDYARPATRALRDYPSVIAPFQPPSSEALTLDKWNPSIDAAVMRAKLRLNSGQTVVDPKVLTLAEVTHLDATVRTDYVRRPRVWSIPPLVTKASTIIEAFPMDWLRQLGSPAVRRQQLRDFPSVIAPFQPPTAPDTNYVDKWAPSIADVMHAKSRITNTVLGVNDAYSMTLPGTPETVYIAALAQTNYIKPIRHTLQHSWTKMIAIMEANTWDWITKLDTPMLRRQQLRDYPSTIAPFQPTGTESITLDKWNPALGDVARAKYRLRLDGMFKPVSTDPETVSLDRFRPMYKDLVYPPKRVALGWNVNVLESSTFTAVEFIGPDKWTEKYADILRPRPRTALGFELIDPSRFPEAFRSDWFQELSRTIPELRPLVAQGLQVIDARVLLTLGADTLTPEWLGERADIIWKRKPLIAEGLQVTDSKSLLAAEENLLSKWIGERADIVWKRKPLVPEGLQVIDARILTVGEDVAITGWLGERADIVWKRKPLVPKGLQVTDAKSLLAAEESLLSKWLGARADYVWKRKPLVAEGLQVIDGRALTIAEDVSISGLLGQRPDIIWKHKPLVAEGWTAIDAKQLTLGEVILADKWIGEYADYVWKRKPLVAEGLTTIDAKQLTAEGYIFADKWTHQRPDFVWKREPLTAEGWIVIDARTLLNEEEILISKWNGSRPDINWKRKPLVPEGIRVIDPKALTAAEATSLDKWIGERADIVWGRTPLVPEGFIVTDCAAPQSDITMERWYRPTATPVWHPELRGWYRATIRSEILLTFQLPFLGTTTTRAVIWVKSTEPFVRIKSTRLRKDSDDE